MALIDGPGIAKLADSHIQAFFCHITPIIRRPTTARSLADMLRPGFPSRRIIHALSQCPHFIIPESDARPDDVHVFTRSQLIERAIRAVWDITRLSKELEPSLLRDKMAKELRHGSHESRAETVTDVLQAADLCQIKESHLYPGRVWTQLRWMASLSLDESLEATVDTADPANQVALACGASPDDSNGFSVTRNLSLKKAKVFALRYGEGLSAVEIARRVGVSRARIHQLQSAARSCFPPPPQTSPAMRALLTAVLSAPSPRLHVPDALVDRLALHLGTPVASTALIPLLQDVFRISGKTLFGGKLIWLPAGERMREEVAIERMASLRRRTQANFTEALVVDGDIAQFSFDELALLMANAELQEESRPSRTPRRPANSRQRKPKSAPVPVIDSGPPMRGAQIFAELEVAPSLTITIEAARRVVTALEALDPPRSLCEIRPSTPDFQWLEQWAARLTSAHVAQFLDGSQPRRIASGDPQLTRQEVFGTLMLLFCAETARRRAREGFVWSSVAPSFPNVTGVTLFAGGQPTRGLKDAIEAAAYRLEVRHVFGQEGTLNWYLSIYHQFGFTRQGIKHLAHWLAGHAATSSISALSDGPVASTSFQRLWNALRNFRRNNISRKRLVATLADSPWVLDEWTDEILIACLKRIELGATDRQNALAGDGSAQVDFLAPVSLHWDSSQAPSFRTSVVNLSLLPLEDPRYDLVSDDVVLDRIEIQTDETYLGRSEQIAVSAQKPEALMLLRDSSGAVCASQTLSVWSADDEIDVFEMKTGRRLKDPWRDRMYTSRAYGLLVSSDLEPSVPLPLWHDVVPDMRRLYLLPSGWDPSFCLTLEGQPLWSPHASPQTPTGRQEPDWARRVRVTLHPHRPRFGDRISFSVTGLPPEASLTYMKYGTTPLEWQAKADAIYSEPLEVDPATTARQQALRLGINANGDFASVLRAIPIQVTGSCYNPSDGWHVLHPDVQLTVQQARSSLFRIIPEQDGRTGSSETHALVEGSTFVGRLKQQQAPLSGLAGLGAPLRAVPGPYNAVTDGMQIAAAVVDPGIIAALRQPDEESIELELLRELEVSENHSIVFYLPGETPVITPLAPAPPARSLRYTNPFKELSSPFGMLAFEGRCIGAAWPRRWQSLATILESDPDSALLAAAMVKWGHLPLLSPHFTKEVASFVEHNLTAVIAAWILDRGLPSPLSHSSETEQWIDAVRHYLMRGRPSPQQCQEIVSLFGPLHLTATLAQATEQLGRFSPIFATRVALSAICGAQADSHSPRLQLDSLRNLISSLAELEHDFSPATLRRYSDELSCRCAERLGVAPDFLKRSILNTAQHLFSGKETVGRLHLQNLTLALSGYPVVRQFILFSLLTWIYQYWETQAHGLR